jgi:hypothetical protein
VGQVVEVAEVEEEAVEVVAEEVEEDRSVLEHQQ